MLCPHAKLRPPPISKKLAVFVSVVREVLGIVVRRGLLKLGQMYESIYDTIRALASDIRVKATFETSQMSFNKITHAWASESTCLFKIAVVTAIPDKTVI
jgi:hypothetical protein